MHNFKSAVENGKYRLLSCPSNLLAVLSVSSRWKEAGRGLQTLRYQAKEGDYSLLQRYLGLNQKIVKNDTSI